MTQLQDNIASTACTAFWAALPSDVDFPSADAWKSAEKQGRDAAIQFLREQTASDSFVADIGQLEDDFAKRLWLDISQLAREVNIAQPVSQSRISEWRLAVAALIGSMIGSLFFGTAAHTLLDMRDAGILFGGPLVAYFFVWKSAYLAQNQARSQGLLGSLYARAWRSILLSQSTKTYSRVEGEFMLKNYWEIWSAELIAKIKLWIIETRGSSLAAQNSFPDEVLLVLNTLNTASDDALRTAVSQTLTVFRNYGVDIPDRREEIDSGMPPLMVWHVSMGDEYDVFDDISPGDKVTVLRDPIKVHGKLKVKGMVRKHYEAAR